MTDPSNRGAHFITAIGRLRPGVTLEAARRDMAMVGARLQAEYPKSNANFGGTAEALQTWLTGDVRIALLTMFGAVMFVLLIACANVANLLLVRATGRETEIAVRTALGAGRGRIVRQLVTESVLLSGLGALIGSALAAWAVDAVVVFGPAALPRREEISIDNHVLVFSAIMAVVTGLAFGLVPAMHAAKAELGQMLKEGIRGASGRRATQRTRSMLVVTEMALAVVLLVGAGLLIKSFARLLHVDPGFRTAHIVSFDVTVPETRYPHDRDIRRFAQQIRERLASLPETQDVAVAFARPLEAGAMRATFDIQGRPPLPANKRMVADIRPASANFFSTMGMRMVHGRLFTKDEESFGPPPVVIVNKSFAARYFPNEEPIGHRLILGISHDTAGKNSEVTTQGAIVGVVNDVRQQALDKDPYPAVYVGWGTLPINDISFLVHSSAATPAIFSAIRESVHAVDGEMPIYGLRTMQDAMSESVAQPRFYMLLLSAFAALALLLAALGIYGVISYTVTQRTRELGIRIALGATHDRVVRLVLGQGAGLTIIGIVTGLLGAYWLTHLLSALLYAVAATDVATFATVAAVLLAVSVCASYVPARRAAAVDPVIAMRAD